MNNTGNSLPMALPFHGGCSLVHVGFLPLGSVVPADPVFVALGCGAAIGSVVWGPKSCRRSR
jgi:hypothetical protein